MCIHSSVDSGVRHCRNVIISKLLAYHIADFSVKIVKKNYELCEVMTSVKFV